MTISVRKKCDDKKDELEIISGTKTKIIHSDTPFEIDCYDFLKIGKL